MVVSRTWQEIGALDVAMESGIFSDAEIGGVAVCGVMEAELPLMACNHLLRLV